MFVKSILSVLCLSLLSLSTLKSKEQFSNFKDYKITETEFKLEKIAEDLIYPWAITFIDNNNLIVTEKPGGLYKINTSTGKKELIKHNIQHINIWQTLPRGGRSQGGLLDTYFNKTDGLIYFTYSHLKSSKYNQILKSYNKTSNTAIARGKLVGNEIKALEVLFIAKPPQIKNKHFGSRITIKNNMLYAGLGDRGMGMISQDATKHSGSIIRIKTNGEIPKDNPKFKGNIDWLPEIYQIGVRNSQGITISPHDGEVYFSNHGPRGGDHIGKVKSGANYGWKHIAWGGSEYSGFRIGEEPFNKKYDMPLKIWVPSIGISTIKFYTGDVFPEWKGDLLICSLLGKSLIRLDFENNKIVGEEIIFKDKIGRIWDF
jgi:quinoprotein glucose dehydrogenase